MLAMSPTAPRGIRFPALSLSSIASRAPLTDPKVHDAYRGKREMAFAGPFFMHTKPRHDIAPL